MKQTSSERNTPLAPVAPAPSGMKCPVCANFIPVSIHQLLHEGSIMCPYCGLQMIINKSQSQHALDALRKVEHVAEQVKKTETFKR